MKTVKVTAGTLEVNEKTLEIKEDLDVGVYPVTQEEYEAVIGSNPSEDRDPNYPVTNVSWYDAVAYANALSVKEGLTPFYKIEGTKVENIPGANGYRLPTEEEWEYCCRAGTTGDRYGDLDEIAWYSGNSNDHIHEVGQKKPNNFGLYDTLGNVWEWVRDAW